MATRAARASAGDVTATPGAAHPKQKNNDSRALAAIPDVERGDVKTKALAIGTGSLNLKRSHDFPIVDSFQTLRLISPLGSFAFRNQPGNIGTHPAPVTGT